MNNIIKEAIKETVELQKGYYEEFITTEIVNQNNQLLISLKNVDNDVQILYLTCECIIPVDNNIHDKDFIKKGFDLKLRIINHLTDCITEVGIHDNTSVSDIVYISLSINEEFEEADKKSLWAFSRGWD